MKTLLGIYKKMCAILFTFVAKLSAKNQSAKIKANGFTRLTPNTVLGANIHFNGFRVYGRGRVSIGDNFHSGKNCKVITDIHNYNGTKLPYDETIISKNVKIGANVWLGMDVTILGGCTIGDGAIIQAGSVVVKNIERMAIAGGHPATVFSKRDEDHYNTLAATNSFF